MQPPKNLPANVEMKRVTRSQATAHKDKNDMPSKVPALHQHQSDIAESSKRAGTRRKGSSTKPKTIPAPASTSESSQTQHTQDQPPQENPNQENPNQENPYQGSPIQGNRTHEASTQEASGNDFVLRLAIDYGTVFLSVAYSIRRGDSAGTKGLISFPEGSANSPVVLYWAAEIEPDGELLWGRPAKDRRQTDRERVIQLPKLALYEHKTPAVDEIHRQLRSVNGGVSLVELIAMHLKSVISYSITQIKTDKASLDLTSEEVDVALIDREVFISVPEAWDPSSNEKMRVAAKQAGIAKFQLVSEPECAAAFAMNRDLETKQNMKVKRSADDHADEQLVIDAGGGTVDLVRYRMLDEAGAKCGLRIVGQANGSLCGSTRINDAFVQEQVAALTTDPGFLDNMGMTEESLRVQLFTGFDKHKEYFPNDFEEPTSVTVQGSKRRKHIEVTKADMQRHFDAVIEKVFKLIDETIKGDDPTYMILSGGFGSSRYLQRMLDNRYKSTLITMNSVPGRNAPIAEGALLRHDKIMMEGAKQKYTYFVTQVEEFDPVHHPEALAAGRVRPSKYDENISVVNQRIKCIVLRGDASDNKKHNADIWQDFYVTKSHTTITVAIFWSAEEVNDHSALKDVDYRFWRMIRMPIDRKVIEESGSKAPDGPDGLPGYRLDVHLVFRVTGALMDVGMQIMHKGQKWRFERALEQGDEEAQKRHCREHWDNSAQLPDVVDEGEDESSAADIDGINGTDNGQQTGEGQQAHEDGHGQSQTGQDESEADWLRTADKNIMLSKDELAQQIQEELHRPSRGSRSHLTRNTASKTSGFVDTAGELNNVDEDGESDGISEEPRKMNGKKKLPAITDDGSFSSKEMSSPPHPPARTARGRGGIASGLFGNFFGSPARQGELSSQETNHSGTSKKEKKKKEEKKHGTA